MSESAKVIIKEFDGTQINPDIDINSTFFAGMFEKGPVDAPVLINSARQFKNIFGRAIKENLNDWYQVYNFLQYPETPSILVSRAIGPNSYNAFKSKPWQGNPVQIYGYSDFITKEYDFLEPDNFIKIAARNPGEWGNLLDICIFTAKEFNENKEIKKGFFARNLTKAVNPGYYFIVVFRKDFVVETFNIKFNDIETINKNSNYIYLKQRFLDYKIYDGNLYWVDGDVLLADGNLPHDLKPVFYGTNSIKLSGGVTEQPSKDDIIESYNSVDNKEQYQINLIIANERHPEAAVNLAKSRKDAAVIIGSPKNCNTLEENLKYITRLKSDYSYYVSNYKKQFDEFSQKYFWCNFAGDIAGLRSRLIQANGNRESHCKIIYNLLNVTQIEKNYHVNQRDIFANNQINTVVQNTNNYTVLGEFLLTENITNDLTTRLILNNIESRCDKIARYFIFEFNDDFTRRALASNLRIVLDDSKAADEIDNYMIVCDDTNNGEQVIAQNKLICDVFIKPKFLVNEIHLRFATYNLLEL